MEEKRKAEQEIQVQNMNDYCSVLDLQDHSKFWNCLLFSVFPSNLRINLPRRSTAVFVQLAKGFYKFLLTPHYIF